MGKTLGIEGVVGQKVEPLALHLPATAARDPPHLQFKENPRVATRQVAHPAHLAVVPAHLDMTATAARGFFERRWSVITRAFGSPKMPRTVGSGRKPGKQYASHSRLRRRHRRAIQIAWQIPAPAEMQNPYAIHSFPRRSAPDLAHTTPRRPLFLRVNVVAVEKTPERAIESASCAAL